MKKGVLNYIFMFWAAGGAALFFLAFVHFAYQFSLTQGALPFNSPLREAVWFTVFGLCWFTSVFAFAAQSFPSRMARLVATLFYFLAMPGVLFIMGLIAACMNGDCL